MTTSSEQPYDQTISIDTDDEQVILEIPKDHVVWSVNPRGDHTYITIKKVEL